MNVRAQTRFDRDLLLAGADLEAVLADREKEKLESDERTQARLRPDTVARLGYLIPAQDEDRAEPTRFSA